MSITLYTAPDCIRCKIVKAFLAERNIEYGTVDFKENAQEFNTFYRTNRKAIYRNPEGVEFPLFFDGGQGAEGLGEGGGNVVPGVTVAEGEAEGFGSGEVFDVAGHDGAHFPDGGVGVVGGGVAAEQGHMAGDDGGKAGGIGEHGRASGEEIGMILKDGGIMERAAGIHDGMHAGTPDAGKAVCGGKEVAAGDDGNGKRADEFREGVVSGNAAEALPGGAGVQGYPARAEVLKPQGKVLEDVMRVVEAETELEAHAPGACGGNERAGHVEGVVDVAEHGRARALLEHLVYGTAHVEIKPAITGIAQERGGPAEKGGFRAEELHDERLIGGHAAEQIVGAGTAVDKPLGADHFRHADGRAVAAAEQTEGQVAVARQRRKPGSVGGKGQGVGRRAGTEGQGGSGDHASGFPGAGLEVASGALRK